MAWDTSAGATFSLAQNSAMPATFDAAGYAALSWVEVAEVTNIGEFGKEFALVSHQPLSKRGVAKRKGSYNNGTLNPALAMDMEDDGQQLLAQAAESDDPWPIRVQTKRGVTFYMVGLVMSFRPNIGEADSVITASPTIELDNPALIRVDPV